jgi:NADPH:quinone reductase-like Zn-dependent oxidoreductase
VTGVCSGRNRGLVLALGADRVIDYTKEDFTRGAGRFDVVFDAIGVSSFTRARAVLTRHGRYVTTVPSLRILGAMASSVFRTRKAVVAFTGLAPRAEMTGDLAVATALAEDGALRPVIDAVYPMAAARDAHERVETGRKVGSVVLTMTASD